MLGGPKLHRVHYKQTCQGDHLSRVPTALDTIGQGTARLLAGEEGRYYELGQVVVLDSRQYGSKHHYGAKVTSIGQRYRRKICEDPPL